MKKLLTITLVLLCAPFVYSQGQNWLLNGNTILTGDYLGTNNNEPLIFKANGNEGLRIKPNGDLRITNFDDNTFNGLVYVNTNGVLSKLNFTGNPNEVLLGNGTFSNISSVSGWFNSGGVVSTTQKVVIGTISANEKLNVDGNILATGTISGTSLNVVDIVGAGKEFKISTSLCMKGIDVNTPGSRNELCGMNGDLFIQSEHNNPYSTVFAYDNGSKVGIGIVPTESFHVAGIARFEDKVYMNKIVPIDSVFSIGDSTLHFSSYYNNIWGSVNPNGSVQGVGFGAPNAYGVGQNSVAIGYKIKANGANSIVIGSTGAGVNQLVNNINNSLMVGFNSDLPTLTVRAASGNNTTGKVGIGTDNPMAKLDVRVNADPQVGGYGILTTSNVPTVKSISVIHKDPSQNIDEENFIVYTNGKVYCREVFVKLGVLGDFVFDENYDLMNYHELENYLKLNKHLPGVPSEPEVLNAGLNVGEMQAVVLQKTEENTLYILDLNKRLEASKAENEKLKNELEEMKKRQAALEEKMNEVLIKK